MEEFIAALVEILGIKKDVEICLHTLKTKKAAMAEHTYSYYNGKVLRHWITVYLSAKSKHRTHSLEWFLAHEMLHAWQAENGMLSENHGPEFRKMADFLFIEINKRGFSIDMALYDMDIDAE